MLFLMKLLFGFCLVFCFQNFWITQASNLEITKKNYGNTVEVSPRSTISQSRSLQVSLAYSGESNSPTEKCKLGFDCTLNFFGLAFYIRQGISPRNFGVQSKDWAT